MLLDAEMLHCGMNTALVMRQILIGQFTRRACFDIIQSLIGLTCALFFKFLLEQFVCIFEKQGVRSE